MKNSKRRSLLILFLTLCSWTIVYGQITPSDDAYTNTALPTTNLGAKPLLDVESASQTTFVRFDLSSLPSGYTGANISKATLKLYVNAVTTAGSFNVDFVNGTWSEKTITADLSPALGTTIVSSVSLTSANVHDYIVIDVTSALTAWLDGTQANDGIALVANSPLNASFDSKENTTMSHPPELDIVFSGGGTITGITTAAGSGLIGGGTSGTLNLGLTKSCAANQVLEWNGSSWACAAVGTGTITAVNAGIGLLGGGASGNVTLNVDTTKIVTGLNAGLGLAGGGTGGVPTLNVDPTQVPFLNAAANTFNGNQNINGAVTVASNATYQPLFVQSSSNFGTWFQLNNTSTGGHNWAILSAGGANAEGAGNLGITNFTGNSSIYLEGNVKANSLSINSDTPMSSNPHMAFSGFMAGNLGVDVNGNYPLGGLFIPDLNITITRISASENSPGHDCQGDAILNLDNPTLGGGLIAQLDLGYEQHYVDSGPLNIPVSAGTWVVIGATPASACLPVIGQSPSNVSVNVQYLMQ
jgi:hypothetical protein